MQLMSYRTNGSAYLYRRVRIILYYRPTGTSSWIYAAERNVYPGATTAAVNYTFDHTWASSGTYDYYFVVEFYDHTGTWGSVGQWIYDQAYSNGTTVTATVGNDGGPGVTASTTLTATLGSYAPPSGWEIYQVVYSASISGEAKATGASTSTTTCSASASSLTSLGGRGVSSSSGLQSAPYDKAWSVTESVTTFNRSRISGSLSASFSSSGGYCSGYAHWGYATGTISNPSALIKIRRYDGGSTTPANSISIGTVGYNLTSGLVLAEGTMNWFAIGR
jgi:hypothetical protein